MREERRRNGEEGETDQDAFAPVDVAAEITNRKTCHGHAQGACIGGKSHGGGRHAVMAGERGKDGLRGEQIHHGEKGSERDDNEAEERAGRMRVGRDGRSFDCALGHGWLPRLQERRM